jgi:hypothetical protein
VTPRDPGARLRSGTHPGVTRCGVCGGRRLRAIRGGSGAAVVRAAASALAAAATVGDAADAAAAAVPCQAPKRRDQVVECTVCRGRGSGLLAPPRAVQQACRRQACVKYLTGQGITSHSDASGHRLCPSYTVQGTDSVKYLRSSATAGRLVPQSTALIVLQPSRGHDAPVSMVAARRTSGSAASAGRRRFAPGPASQRAKRSTASAAAVICAGVRSSSDATRCRT